MGRSRTDLSDRKFGRLTAINCSHIDKGGNAFWNVECKCGNVKVVSSSNLLRGQTNSCGCILKEMMTTHGKSSSKVYVVWRNMIIRTTDEKSDSYQFYGERGIKVCDKWLKFEGFYEDMGDQPRGMTLERKDVNGNYCKDNCVWATIKEQANNRRNNRFITYNCETKTISQWAEKLKINYGTLVSRLNESKWSIEKAFTTPTRVWN